MKTLFLSILIICSLFVKATIYYVDIAGNNDNDGSQTQPWATLMYAVTQATNHGDTIFINSGTHNLSSECDLPVGVSLLGEGNNSVINITAPGEWAYGIWLVSNEINTDGDQSVSHIRFTGNSLNAYGALMIRARGNIKIHDCEFEDFDDCAVTFDGQINDGNGLPVQWTIGNRFYNNIVTNCCKRQVGDWMSGALQIGAQEGMRIYNNHFTENERGGAQCGYPIKYYSNGYLRDLKIYDNTIVKLPAIEDYSDWNFAIELWNWMGGIEIYNNHIEGSIDVDHVVKGDYTFGTKIHNNFFGYPSLPTSSGNWTNLNAGIYIEFACNDVNIFDNEFKNLETPIRFSPRDETLNDINIYYNLFNQIGNEKGDDGCNLINFSGSGFTINNLKFLNNTVYTGTNGAAYGLILSGDNYNNVAIQNNIFYGFTVSPIEIDGSNTNDLDIENNLFYSNGNDFPNLANVPSNYNNRNNISDNPDFVTPNTDFSLQSTSPAIDKGKDVGLLTDYLGNQVEGLPDIGAFEYKTPTSIHDPFLNKNKLMHAYLNQSKDCIVIVKPPINKNYQVVVSDVLGRRYYKSDFLSGADEVIIPQVLQTPGLNVIGLLYENSIKDTQKIIFN